MIGEASKKVFGNQLHKTMKIASYARANGCLGISFLFKNISDGKVIYIYFVKVL